jgi:hypothetical protein
VVVRTEINWLRIGSSYGLNFQFLIKRASSGELKKLLNFTVPLQITLKSVEILCNG